MRSSLRRRRGRKWAVSSLVAALAFVVLALPARATVMIEVPVEELVREAHAIVHGTVTRTGTRMIARGDSLDPYTLVWIRVRRWLKGRGGRTVLVREMGGVGAVAAAAVQGGPEYEVGEEVVVFLERHGAVMRTASMAQGKFQVVRGAPGAPVMVRRDLQGMGFARFRRGGMVVAPATGPDTMRLDELLEVIERSAAFGGNRGVVVEEAP
jgi:hypothetical protein